MNDPSNKRSSGSFSSDEQMDGLLQDFFKLETPSALNRPFRRPVASRQESLATSLVTPSTSELTVAPRNHKTVVAMAIAVLAMSLILAMKVQAPSSGGSNASEMSNTQPAEPSEELMLVSPNGDASSTQAVGEDGVTLEETDSIELKSQK